MIYILKISRTLKNSEKYVSCASGTLTSTEKGYSQIEQEALAIIYGLKKFHSYVFGMEFEMQTDHKLLLKIFSSKKGIPIHVAKRLQRWAQ